MKDPATLARAVGLHQQARTHAATGRVEEALASYEKARRLLPDHLPLLAEFARYAYEHNRWAAAATLYRHIGTLKPDSGFEGPLGLALVQQREFAEAIPFLQKQRARTPEEPGLLRALAAALAKVCDWDTALACAADIARLEPEHPALDIEVNAHFYTGNATALDERVDPVLARYHAHPAVLAIIGMHLLKRGEIARGLAIQHACHWGGEHDRAADSDLTALAAWNGTADDGLLVVTGEQGLGEEILASRFFGALAASGQRCVITCEPRLLPLFRRSFPGLHFIAHGSEERVQLVAEHAPRWRLRALDLGTLFLGDTLAGRTAWLQPDSARVEQNRAAYRARWPGRRLIGISWASRRRIQDRYGKSMPVETLAPLLQREDCVAVNCQYGDTADDLAALAAAGLTAPWQDPDIDSTRDPDGLLAQLAALDGYIGVSNSTIHLAGAAGLPAILLLPEREPVFWYWGYEGERTPWYPSLRLLRNGPGQDWSATFRRALESI